MYFPLSTSCMVFSNSKSFNFFIILQMPCGTVQIALNEVVGAYAIGF